MSADHNPNRMSDATKLPELLPCPFCGAAPEVDNEPEGCGCTIECMSRECLVRPTIYCEGDDDQDAGEIAYAEWNRRDQAGRAPAPGDITRLQEALRTARSLIGLGCPHLAVEAIDDHLAKPIQPAAPVVTEALLTALAFVRWNCFGECRTEGFTGPMPRPDEMAAMLNAALAKLPRDAASVEGT